MSLNLISSLSFLKSKLGTVGGSPSSRLDIRTTTAVRKSEYAAAGLSDSDSSFTDSEEESDGEETGHGSTCSPQFNTQPAPPPPSSTRPSTDILKKCLDILNNDLSESDTLPVSNIGMKITSPPEIGPKDEKKTVGPSIQQDLLQGLLKIASPPPPSQPATPSSPRGRKRSHSSCSTSSSDSDDAGPPILEPMVSQASFVSSVPNTVNLNFQAAISRPVSYSSAIPSSVTYTCNNKPAIITSGQMSLTPSSFSAIPAYTSVSTKPVQTNSTLPSRVQYQPPSSDVQTIILPPIKAGQSQQIIIQPKMEPTVFQPPQPQFLTGYQQPSRGVEIVQTSVPLQLYGQAIPLLNPSGQLLGSLTGVNSQDQLINNLQNYTVFLQHQNGNIPNQKSLILGPSVQPKIIQTNQIRVKKEPMTNFENIQPTQSSQPYISFPVNLCNSLGSANPVTTPSNPIILQPTATPEPQGKENITRVPQNNILATAISTAFSSSMVPNPLISTPLPLTSGAPSSTIVKPSPASVQLVSDPTRGTYSLVPTGVPSSSSSQFVCTPTLLPSAPLTNLQTTGQDAWTTSLPSTPVKVPKLGPTTGEPQQEAAQTKFMCGVCKKFFGNTKNLRVHISEIHEGKRGHFPCNICHKVFPRKRNMERHKNALHLKNNPVCPLCLKVVVNIGVHIKRFHRGSQDAQKVSAATA